MKKIAVFVLFFPVSVAFSMSQPAKILQPSQKAPSAQQADSNTTALIKSAVQEICDGNFIAAEQILSNTAEDDSNTAGLCGIISQYKQIQLARQQAKQEVFSKQLAELEKLKARPEMNEPNLPEIFPTIVKWVEDKWLWTEGEPNLPEIFPVITRKTEGEPNLLEVFPAIIRADELATDAQKQQILADEFVQKTIAKARQVGNEYESKGQWLDSLIYCYSWLSMIYEDDKTISEKKKELEEKTIIKASLMDNPCETCTDRYRKVKPEMFTRSLDVLEYGYVEPFYYSDMADKAIKRCRYLAEVLRVLR